LLDKIYTGLLNNWTFRTAWIWKYRMSITCFWIL